MSRAASHGSATASVSNEETGVQAGAARRVLGTQPEKVDEVLSSTCFPLCSSSPWACR
jgi:hypothetical protein